MIDASGLIGHYAGRLLADLGADVIKVEPPGGDPARSYPPFLPGVPAPENGLQFLLLNANKRGVVLDLTASRDRGHFLRLLDGADVLLESWRPQEARALGLTPEVFEAGRPALVHASITGWGLSGPRAEWAYADIVGLAMSGVMTLAGFPDGPPEQLGDLQGYHSASIDAAAGVVAALYERDFSGLGQRVEVSLQEALLMAQETAMQFADILGQDRARAGEPPTRTPGPGTGLFEAADGYVYVVSGTAGAGFGGVLDLMAVTDDLGDLAQEPYASFVRGPMSPVELGRMARSPQHLAELEAMAEHVRAAVAAFIKRYPRQYLYEQGQQRRLLIGMVSTPQDISTNTQLNARQWFVEIEDRARGRTLRYPGPPWRLTGSPATLRHPAPLLGEHNRELLGASERQPSLPARAAVAGGAANRRRPLEGVKLLDLTWFGAGPVGTRALANLGADVVRVETQRRLDGLRVAQPRPADNPSLNVSGYFNNFNAEKRSIMIDLTTERGHELGIELAQWADLFMTNMTNRAIRQVGLTWEQLSAANPDLIAMYQPMQGLTGPHSEFLGFGAVLNTLCGVSYTTGFPQNPPVGSGSNYPDYVVNPIHAAIALIAALRHRHRTGKGQLIDMSQLESSVAAMAGPVFAWDNARTSFQRAGNRVAFAAPHGAFAVAGEDRWMVLACLDDSQWQRAAAACGHPEWARDARFATLGDRKANEDALEALIAAWAARQDGWAAVRLLQQADVPAGMVQRASEVLRDEHLVARRYFAYLDHPEAGVRSYDGPGWRMSRTPVEVRSCAPLFGEHTDEIARGILRLSADEIAELVVQQVLY